MQQANPIEQHSGSASEDSRTSEGVQKIAALVATVDACAAQQILTQLPPKIARQVRAAVKDLKTIPPAEQSRLLAELATASKENNASKQNSECKSTAVGAEADAPEDEFAAWQSIGASNLAKVLSGERAQVIAVVLTQLNDQFAAEVLAQFDPRRSQDILRAASELGTVARTTQKAIRRSVALQIERLQEERRRKQASLQRVHSIIDSAPEPLRDEWNAAINQPTSAVDTPPHLDRAPIDNPALALLHSEANAGRQKNQTHTPRTIPLAENPNGQGASSKTIANFATLIRLPKDVMASVMDQLDEETILIALAGAPPEWAAEFEALLSKDDFRLIEKGIHSLGAISLSDIDRAQAEFVSAANRLLATTTSTLRATA